MKSRAAITGKEATAVKKPEKVPLREAFRLNSRAVKLIWQACPSYFVSTIIYAVFNALFPLAGIWFSAQILNELAGPRRPDVLWKLVVLTLAVTAALELAKSTAEHWVNSRRSLMGISEWKIYSEKMMSMDYHLAEEPRTAGLVSQALQSWNWGGWGLSLPARELSPVLSALFQIAGSVALTVPLFLQQVPVSAGALTVLNRPLSVVLLLMAMAAVTLAAPALTNRAESYETRFAEDAKFSNRLVTFNGYAAFSEKERTLDIRMYRQDTILRAYGFLNTNFKPGGEIANCARGPMGILNALSAVVSYLFTGVAYVFVCLKAWAGAFGVGAVTQYVGAVTSLSAGIITLGKELGTMRNNAAFLRTTFKFLDIPNTMYQGSLTVEKRSDHNYEIEFRDVSFHYPESDTWALRHVSMKFKVGKRLAVVGRNGSGKTTFIKLLCRLYDPTEGEILLNGINIRKYNYQEYISIFSVVFQDFQLFAFPLGQNVAVGTAYDRKKAETCLKEAAFSERLKSLPKGLDTCLYREFGEDGVEISGGEAQKIAIARTLYKDAPFLILDEPTAALDPVAEYEIYLSFNKIIGDKTAVYISHRLSSCRFCDEVAVFSHGQIVQYGTHDNLVKDTSGLYYRLWNAQAQYYQKNKEAE
jgi:ATP-binding cassette subfamily B protein